MWAGQPSSRPSSACCRTSSRSTDSEDGEDGRASGQNDSADSLDIADPPTLAHAAFPWSDRPMTRPTRTGPDVGPGGRTGLWLEFQARANLPRSVFVKRASLPFVLVSLRMAEY